MPKLFVNERPLPFRKVTFKPKELSVPAISRVFAEQPGNTICLVFDGFEEACLGFLFHVRKKSDRFELLNIRSQVELIVDNEKQLIEVIKHVSGLEYSDAVQRAFQQIRNEIGSGIALNGFKLAT